MIKPHSHASVPTPQHNTTQHRLVEYYDTHTQFAKEAIAAAIDGPIPSLHLQIDLWSTPVTREDMLGVYATFLDKDMDAHGVLLAARHFRPTPEMKQKGADLLLLYLEDIAEQFDFTLLQHVFSLTTDAGANIRKLATQLLDRNKRVQEIRRRLALQAARVEDSDDSDDSGESDSEAEAAAPAEQPPDAAERAALEKELAALEELAALAGAKAFWTWCKCHQAHLTCVEAAGVDLLDSKKNNSNPAMQALVLELVDFVNAVNSRTNLKIAYEAALLAGAGRREKLRSVVKQRWASLAKLLRRVLRNMDAIKAACKEERKICAFLKKKALLLELYSIIQPVAAYIERSQASMARTRHPVVVAAHYDLIGLRRGVLNKNAPLMMLDPETEQPKVEEVEMDVDGEEEKETRFVTRTHAGLSAVAQQVRLVLAAGFDNRGLKAQYTVVEYDQRAADMAMFLYPPMASLGYIDIMGDLYEADLTDVMAMQTDVEEKVQGLVELAITRERRAKAAAGAAAAPAAARPSAGPKFFKGKPKPKASANHYLQLGLLPVQPMAPELGSGEEKSAEQMAAEIVKKYKEAAARAVTEAGGYAEFVKQYPPDHVHEWWKTQREGPLKAVARAVLGQAASSAPLENSFSTGADICTRRRSSLKPHRVEMLLVCGLMRRVVTLTPDEVNEIPVEEIEERLPGRFTRKSLITDLNAFGDELLGALEVGEELPELSGAEEMEIFQGWSSLAEWGAGDLDLDGVAEWEAYWAPATGSSGSN